MKRKYSYDYIRVISILMVICIHVVSTIKAPDTGSLEWICVTLLNSICAVSIPLFFMISGALLLSVDVPITTANLFRKRIMKISVPFLLWSIIYIFARIILGKLPLDFVSFLSIWNKPVYYQFWFIYTIMAIYLILPLLQKLVIGISKASLEYILVLWAIFSLTIPLLGQINTNWILTNHFNLNFINGYLGYFILGYYLSVYPFQRSDTTLIITTLFSFSLTFFATMIEASLKIKGSWVGIFMQSYLTPFTALASIGIFSFFQKYEKNLISHTRMNDFIFRISEATFGIYFVHMLIVYLINNIKIVELPILLIITMQTFIVFLVSTLTVFLISKSRLLAFVLLGMEHRK